MWRRNYAGEDKEKALETLTAFKRLLLHILKGYFDIKKEYV